MLQTKKETIMQSSTVLTTQTGPVAGSPAAERIPELAHREAGQLARAEMARFLALVETLRGDDWAQPTLCTAWNVRDILAHQAGAYASSASLAEFRRQVIGNPYVKEEAMQVDAINRRQLEDRQDHPPEALLAELRYAAPRAITNRQRLPWVLRALPVPFGPPLGTAPLSYLMDNIYTRDTWMHRYDICTATGRAMELTAEHDGRITALVVRDLANILGPLPGRGFLLALSGPAGGSWAFGPQPAGTTIRMDALDFHVLASGRAGAANMVARGKASFSGDTAFAQEMLGRFAVPY
jgi:uncharacterized protein (TIGR03083 family)